LQIAEFRAAAREAGSSFSIVPDLLEQPPYFAEKIIVP
jgi:hypothetical protein